MSVLSKCSVVGCNKEAVIKAEVNSKSFRFCADHQAGGNGDSQSTVVEESKQTNTKEETFMNNVVNKFKGINYGDVVNKVKGYSFKDSVVVGAIGSAVGKLGSFVKKHALKSLGGLACLTVAGTFTSGLGAALVVGSALYAAAAYALKVVQNKKAEKKKTSQEMLVAALGDAGKYGLLGSMVMYFVAGITVALLANSFLYSYVGFNYMAYFIVA